MMGKFKYWFKHTLKSKVHIKVYQVWLIIIIEAILICVLGTFIYKPKTYKVINENDTRGYAINCYHSKEDLRCYVDTKVKQYGRVR